MTTDELRIILRINGASTYTHTINEVTNVTNNYNNSCANLMSTLAKLVSAGMIVKFAKQCIQAASDLQEVANVVDVTFGKNADVVNKWAKSQAQNFGLSETAAKRYIGTYGTMAKQFDMTEEQAASMAIELTKLTGDVASFYNKTDKEAATKLKSIFTGETESLKELGVVMTETQLKAFAMSKGIDKPLKEMTEHEKVLLRYSFVMEKLNHAQGDFARTSDGYANSTRSLSLQLENLKVEIGKGLIPVAASGMQAISSIVQVIGPILVSVAQTLGKYAQAWQQASDTTKMFVKLSLGAIAIMFVAPKVIAVTRAAVKLLTMDIATLGMALNAVLAIAAIVLAAMAISDLSEQVKNMGESSEISSESVDTLSDSLDGLNESTKELDTFLASFDEVNKVGGGNSLMSNLVTADDLANILGAAAGIDDLQAALNGLEMPEIGAGTIFSADWWHQKWEAVKGYLSTFLNGEWKENWKLGFEDIGTWFENNLPKSWIDFWEKLGGAIYDVVEKIREVATAWTDFWGDKGEQIADIVNTGKKQAANSVGGLAWSYITSRHAAGGAPNKGSLFLAGETGAELVGNFGGSQTRVINQSQIGGSEPVINFSPIIQIDGQRITSVVIDGINGRTRSSGSSPLIELGG